MSRSFNKQSRSSAVLDPSSLPSNVATLRGDAFYSLVEELTSKDIEELLRIQQISNARCFLNTKPLVFFDVNSDDPSVVRLQTRLSFQMTDNKKLAVAGVHGHLHYLRELFTSQLVEKKSKRINSKRPTTTNHSVQKVPSSSMQTSSLPLSLTTTADVSTINHQEYLNRKIESWWKKHREKYHLESHDFTEPDDYQIIIGGSLGAVQCHCGKRINIPMLSGRKRYQLSNFYKLLTQNGQCTAIGRKGIRTEPDDDDDSTALFSSSLSSDSASQSHAKTPANKSQQSMKSVNDSPRDIPTHKRQRV